MTSRAKEVFERTFLDRNTARVSSVQNDSDPDSAKEEDKIREHKRQKKRKRVQKPKPKGGRKTVSAFQIKTVPPLERVTSTKYPEILTTDSEFTSVEPQNELVLAKSRFFDKKSASRVEYDHVRPIDFPYLRHMLQRKPEKQFDMHQCNDRERLRANQQAITRSYEESRLRPPIGSERECPMGCDCEGLKITNAKDKAFILVEFLLPTEQKHYEDTGDLPSETRLCLMCKRKEIARAWCNVRADNMGVKRDIILPDYRNLINVEGEYSLSDCIVTSRYVWEGILDPIVLHKRSAYRLIEKNGIPYYEQWRMKYPQKNSEHFFEAPLHRSSRTV